MVLASIRPLLVVIMFHLKQSRVCKRRLRNVLAKHLRRLNSLPRLRKCKKLEFIKSYAFYELQFFTSVLIPLCVQRHANGWFQRHFRLLVPVAVSLPSPVLASRGLPRVLLPELDQVSLLLSRSPPALHVQHVYGERHASSWLPTRLLQNLS